MGFWGFGVLWFVVDIITFMVLLPVLIENLYVNFPQAKL